MASLDESDTVVVRVVEESTIVVTEGRQGPPGGGGPGADGASAYEVAVSNGFVGTEEEWLASLVGPAGPAGADGTNGTNGTNGVNGADGASAYEIAVNNGFIGTEEEWLASLLADLLEYTPDNADNWTTTPTVLNQALDILANMLANKNDPHTVAGFVLVDSSFDPTTTPTVHPSNSAPLYIYDGEPNSTYEHTGLWYGNSDGSTPALMTKGSHDVRTSDFFLTRLFMDATDGWVDGIPMPFVRGETIPDIMMPAAWKDHGLIIGYVSQSNSPSLPVWSLVMEFGWGENVQSPSINDLNDVDTATVAPSDGQALVYDVGDSTWKPGTISGGSGVTESDTAPVSPSSGDFWLRTTDAILFVYYDSSWVEVGGGGGSSGDSLDTTVLVVATDLPDIDLDLSLARVFEISMSEDCTFSFINEGTTGKALGVTICLDGPHTPTFPVNILWPGGIQPTYTAPAVYTFLSLNDGGIWYGMQAGAGFA